MSVIARGDRKERRLRATIALATVQAIPQREEKKKGIATPRLKGRGSQ